MSKNSISIELYFQVTDIWKRLCEEHNNLLDLTFDEYSALLKSDIEEVEKLLADKQKIILTIESLDKLRSSLIERINNDRPESEKIKSISDLLAFMLNSEIEREKQHLYRFNSFLIDIISKIQEQNKKNQSFISKALNNLRDIRETASGKKTYPGYTSQGKVQRVGG